MNRKLFPSIRMQQKLEDCWIKISETALWLLLRICKYYLFLFLGWNSIVFHPKNKNNSTITTSAKGYMLKMDESVYRSEEALKLFKGMRGGVQSEKEFAMRVLLAGQMCHFLKKLSLDNLLTREQLSNIETSLDLKGVDERCKMAVNWVVGYRLSNYDFEDVLTSSNISYEHKCAYLLNNGVTSTYVTDRKVRVVKWVNGWKR
eukprot:GHVR01130159.1.p1 GENE.GHVR01130159.1~~GHVR01130159.1.p1  ORF type:complete len:203 (+),score=11.84 GHVR01130159.1:546-1154(+)